MNDTDTSGIEATSTKKTHLHEVAQLFLRLGFTAFGGPAAHIAMFHDEVVKRRQWLTDEQFLDLLGATNLIPGPNSTEMVIHLGHVRAGWRGLIVAGLCFILPATLIVLILAVLYVKYGTTPAAEWLLYGIKPVVIAIILQAIWNLTPKAIKTPLLTAIGAIALALYLLDINEILLLFGSGFAVMVIENIQRIRKQARGKVLPLALLSGISAPAAATATTTITAPYSLSQLFLTFLKIGAVLYGSGYVLLAFLRTDFVDRLGWLTEQQLLDAVAIGQFTPGPLSTTATFIGYLTGGVPGAIAATVGIFLPSFLFVALTNPLIPRLRRSSWMSALLDGVNVAALGLMTAVTWQLARAALIDLPTILLALVSALLLIYYKVNSTWLIIGGAGVGLIYHLLV
jgi:chromate transporter